MYGRIMGNASKAVRLYIVQLIRIADSRRIFSKKFINAYVRPDNLNQIQLTIVDRNLLEFLHSKKIFYTQLKKILEHLVEESPKKDQVTTLCETLCMINFCIPIMSSTFRHFYQLICNNRSLFINGFFINAIKIHNFYAIFYLVMRHLSSGMESIMFITCMFEEMKILISSMLSQHHDISIVFLNVWRPFLKTI